MGTGADITSTGAHPQYERCPPAIITGANTYKYSVAKRKASQYTDSGRGGRAVNILNEVAKRKASQFHGHAHEGHARRSSMKLRSVKLRNVERLIEDLLRHSSMKLRSVKLRNRTANIEYDNAIHPQ